ncbi:MAG TPA: DUF2849 domain-containing protein [Caulobacterales bacterium]|jgi:hypothetical protein|nr:DUF2849 domain-containing protein [Caulobacterales bacterium]
MKVVTGNRLADGRPVYRTEDGGWTEAIRDAAIFDDEAATDALADATQEETSVVGPYIMTIDAPGAPAAREAVRENIRKLGPSVHPELARKVNVGGAA